MDGCACLARPVQVPSSRRYAHDVERTQVNLSWIGRNRSLELSPRARLVDDAEADVLRRKREALQWRPSNGFLADDVMRSRDAEDDRVEQAA
jgi:hypothetical protein